MSFRIKFIVSVKSLTMKNTRWPSAQSQSVFSNGALFILNNSQPHSLTAASALFQSFIFLISHFVRLLEPSTTRCYTTNFGNYNFTIINSINLIHVRKRLWTTLITTARNIWWVTNVRLLNDPTLILKKRASNSLKRMRQTSKINLLFPFFKDLKHCIYYERCKGTILTAYTFVVAELSFEKQ